MTPDEFQLPVLIVSQPGSVRDMAARVLADMGFSQVMVADNAVRAFAVLTKHRPRLILVDDALRPTSGLVFVRELRATAVASRDAPAVIIAKRSSEVLVRNARKAGADGVIFGDPSMQAIRFWLSCTAPDVRDIIECGGSLRSSSIGPKAWPAARRHGPR